MKIVLGILLLLLLIGSVFLGYKMIQLGKLTKMSSSEMLTTVTGEQGLIVSYAVIENNTITYHIWQNGKETAMETLSQDAKQQNNTNPQYRLDLQYEIGSVTKTMTALLIAKAISENKVALSASVDEYLDLPDGKYYPTIERLLTHTSGYKSYYYESEMRENTFKHRNSFYQISKDRMMARIEKVSLQDKTYPFVYSNFGLSVLGLVLENIYQTDYSELLTNYLQSELHMSDTTVATCNGNLKNYWDWEMGDAYIPAGAVISNVKDMAVYLKFMMTSEEPSVKKVCTPMKQVATGNSINEKMGIRIDEMCMAWCHDTENHLIWHNGATSHFNSYIGFNEDRTKGVILLCNCGPNDSIPMTVVGPKMLTE